MRCFRFTALGMVTSACLITLSPQVSGQEVWSEDLKIVSNADLWARNFSSSAACSETILIIGAPSDFTNGSLAGAAFLFDVTTGRKIAKILPADSVEELQFGCSVSISGATCLVGAQGDATNGVVSGSAYLFEAATGRQIAKLVPADGAAEDRFGHTVAINGTTCIVGAYGDDDNGSLSGSAYHFDVGTAQLIRKILPVDGTEHARFGTSVAICETMYVVGAPNDNGQASDAGTVYLYDRFTGQQIFKLFPDDPRQNHYFGHSVAIGGTTCIVGAYRDSTQGSRTGAAYLFDTTTGLQTAKLLAPDARLDCEFGRSVAISGTACLVGAPADYRLATGPGAAYLFETTTGDQIAKLSPSDGDEDDYFGYAVAMSGLNGIVGATGDDDVPLRGGAAYRFHLEPSCIRLAVTTPVAGEAVTIRITGGTPGVRALVVYGLEEGESSFDDFRGYCAHFDIADLTPASIVGGFELQFDANGEIQFEQYVPLSLSGQRIYLQAAMRGTCPASCVSPRIARDVE